MKNWYFIVTDSCSTDIREDNNWKKDICFMEQLKYFSSREMAEQQQIEKDSLFSTCVLIGNGIYAFTSFKRLPIKWNLRTKEMILVEDLKGYDSRFMADDMVRVGNCIYVLETNGNRLMQFDMNKKVCQYYEIGCHREGWGNYAAFAQWKEELYIFPTYKNEIVKFEIKSAIVKKLSNSYSKSEIDKQKLNLINDNPFIYGFQDKNIVWLFFKQSNLVLAYNLESGVWRIHELSEEINRCTHAVQYNGYIYILSSEGKVFHWNVINNSIRILADCSMGIAEGDLFFKIAVTDRNIYLFPALGEAIFCIDLKDEKIEKYKAYPSDFRYCGPKAWSKYYGYCEDDDFYYFALRSMNFVPCVNKRTGNIEWVKLKKPTYKEYIQNYIKYSNEPIDERECRIIDMAEYLKSNNAIKQEQDYVLTGKKIYGQMKLL